MKLHEIIEENSIKAISQKTKISEENIQKLISENFKSLAKAKALGFISILKREYHGDLKELREKALAYYAEHSGEEESVNIALPHVEEKKGRSKLFLFLMLGLLAYVSWYFFTQFDKKMLGTILPINEGKVQTSKPAAKALPNIQTKYEMAPKQIDKSEEVLDISHALTSTKTDATGVETDIVVASLEPSKMIQKKKHEIVTDIDTHERISTIEADLPVVEKVAQVSTEETIPKEVNKIILKPVKRLWFGMIDIYTKKRKHSTISSPFKIDVKRKSWLIITSSAPFSFVNQNIEQEFNDAKGHYFKVSKEGIKLLTRSEYISQGGYKKW